MINSRDDELAFPPSSRGSAENVQDMDKVHYG